VITELDLKSPSQEKTKMLAKSLLVVEDEVLVARDIKARLTRMGYNVLDTARKGQEAIDKAISLLPDLILMDIHLHDDIDGIEAAIEIRKHIEVPIIFCTAYSNQETLDRAKISAPYGYVLKPFDNRELEINIEIALYKHKTEIDLSNTRRRLNATLTSISEGVIVTNFGGEICLINPVAEQITGWCRQKARFMNLSQVLPLESFEFSGPIFNTKDLGSIDKLENLRQSLIRSDGIQCPIEISVNIISNDRDELVVITFREISQQIEYEEKIRQSTFYDDLTGLPNRALFINRLESAISKRKRGFKDHFAVVFLDLDGFGAVNEGLGHEIGDQLLNEVAARIALTLRPDDTISRFSGDIFAILLGTVDSAAGAIEASNRIQRAIEKPIDLGSTILDISASAGVVFNQDSYEHAEEMIRDADTALHRAKDLTRGSYVIFDKGMYREAVRFIERKTSMQVAMKEGVFEVYYQPIVDVKTEKLKSMEALVRWNHPIEGPISPAEFIPIAERSGLILPLGEFVLRTVCNQIRKWDEVGFNGFRVAVNLSARQFESNIPKLVAEVIEETGISPESLAFEITEGIAMKNVDQNIRMLEELRVLGLSISIDDFGTGYSSLAYLKRFPLNTLKIDQSFIKDITENEDDREITKAIIAMGQNLRLHVLAEGVETTEQVEILRASGCDFIQGYYYARPLPAAQMIPYLDKENLV
jgi:diguanylate cyclase (GGDEF)-like protein/PAS domain S-box-containing protein